MTQKLTPNNFVIAWLSDFAGFNKMEQQKGRLESAFLHLNKGSDDELNRAGLTIARRMNDMSSDLAAFESILSKEGNSAANLISAYQTNAFVLARFFEFGAEKAPFISREETVKLYEWFIEQAKNKRLDLRTTLHASLAAGKGLENGVLDHAKVLFSLGDEKIEQMQLITHSGTVANLVEVTESNCIPLTKKICNLRLIADYMRTGELPNLSTFSLQECFNFILECEYFELPALLLNHIVQRINQELVTIGMQWMIRSNELTIRYLRVPTWAEINEHEAYAFLRGHFSPIYIIYVDLGAINLDGNLHFLHKIPYNGINVSGVHLNEKWVNFLLSFPELESINISKWRNDDNYIVLKTELMTLPMNKFCLLQILSLIPAEQRSRDKVNALLALCGNDEAKLLVAIQRAGSSINLGVQAGLLNSVDDPSIPLFNEMGQEPGSEIWNEARKEKLDAYCALLNKKDWLLAETLYLLSLIPQEHRSISTVHYIETYLLFFVREKSLESLEEAYQPLAKIAKEERGAVLERSYAFTREIKVNTCDPLLISNLQKALFLPEEQFQLYVELVSPLRARGLEQLYILEIVRKYYEDGGEGRYLSHTIDRVASLLGPSEYGRAELFACILKNEMSRQLNITPLFGNMLDNKYRTHLYNAFHGLVYNGVHVLSPDNENGVVSYLTSLMEGIKDGNQGKVDFLSTITITTLSRINRQEKLARALAFTSDIRAGETRATRLNEWSYTLIG